MMEGVPPASRSETHISRSNVPMRAERVEKQPHLVQFRMATRREKTLPGPSGRKQPSLGVTASPGSEFSPSSRKAGGQQSQRRKVWKAEFLNRALRQLNSQQDEGGPETSVDEEQASRAALPGTHT